jgi:hypothetical protein
MIRIEIPNLNDVLKQIPDEKKARTILMRAINRALPTTRKAASVKVRQEYYLKAKKITEITKITKATTSSLSGVLDYRAPMTNLKNFQVKAPKKNPTKQKLRATVKKGGLVAYDGAFIGPNGQVFKRVGKSRLPIKPIYGPSIAQLMRAEKVTTYASEKGSEMMFKRIEHEIGRL